MARNVAETIGQEVELGRTNLAMTCEAAARLAGISPHTQRRIEQGDPSVGLPKVCRAANALGLKVWAKVFPVRSPSLRDTGQLEIAEILRRLASPVYRVVVELGLGNGRSADEVFFGPEEIIHAEIERLLGEWQGQYRPAHAKRDELAGTHHRPVRLVLVVEDTQHNRAVVRAHADLIASMLPASSRQIMHALRTGERLGQDGLLWIRPRDYR